MPESSACRGPRLKAWIGLSGDGVSSNPPHLQGLTRYFIHNAPSHCPYQAENKENIAFFCSEHYFSLPKLSIFYLSIYLSNPLFLKNVYGSMCPFIDVSIRLPHTLFFSLSVPLSFFFFFFFFLPLSFICSSLNF